MVPWRQFSGSKPCTFTTSAKSTHRNQTITRNPNAVSHRPPSEENSIAVEECDREVTMSTFSLPLVPPIDFLSKIELSESTRDSAYMTSRHAKASARTASAPPADARWLVHQSFGHNEPGSSRCLTRYTIGNIDRSTRKITILHIIHTIISPRCMSRGSVRSAILRHLPGSILACMWHFLHGAATTACLPSRT